MWDSLLNLVKQPLEDVIMIRHLALQVGNSVFSLIEDIEKLRLLLFLHLCFASALPFGFSS